MSTETAQVLPVTLSPMDRLYYVSLESGSRFSTKPYVLHTALYYAFGIFPSRFRCAEQTPSYKMDREQSGTTLYIHPAMAIGSPEYETRRFAVKSDEYRSKSKQKNRNLMETGFQKTILPGVAYQTYVTSSDADGFSSFPESSAWYIRVGKKMTPTLVETGEIRTAPVESGSFRLGQPVSTDDIDIDSDGDYDLLGDLRWERMYPVGLLLAGRLHGPYVKVRIGQDIEGERQADQTSGTVSLPTEAGFLTAE
jgi:CRISPR-associated protein Csc1